MYTNVAYLYNSVSVVKDLSVPFLVTSCGYYRVDSGPIIKTNRPKGRRDYQLLYIAEGRASFFFNGVEHILNKGNMILFRPYDPQSYFYYPKEKCEVYWVHFTGSEVESFLSNCAFPTDKNVFHSGYSADYQWLFSQVIQEMQLRRTNYKALLTMLLQHVFLIADRALKEGESGGADVLNEIKRATRYFNEHYNEPINIEEYAMSLHMSPCWFIRRFKQVVKVTPMQYVLSLRMANAKTLLETKDYNVTETANAVGYENALYFSRLFSKHVGISPSEYKKLHTES